MENSDYVINVENDKRENLSNKISASVKKALRIKMEKGSSIASRPPYGYFFNEVYKNGEKFIQLVPRGDETSEVVKKIYTLYLNGWGCGKIASYLNDKSIETPSFYLKNFNRSKFGLWSKNTIKSILINEKYAGIMVQNKWKGIEGNKVVLNNEKERIYGGEFQGIISKEEFFKVQEIMKEKSKMFTTIKREYHLFSSLLNCNECGGAMSYRKNYKGYKCSNSQSGKNRCTAHSVKEEHLKELVFQKFREFYNKEKEKIEFDDMLYKVASEEEDLEKNLRHIEKKITKINSKIEDVILDIEEGVLDQEEKIKSRKELSKLMIKRNKLLRKKEILEKVVGDMQRIDKSKIYIKKVKEVLETNTLSKEILGELIDKILVKEGKDKKNKKDKKIDIILKKI
ncbi:recombinase family protein [Hathewaya limosa]|uniref:Recombinase domain-containing protein n=1 Tax=Hathewaya limosa TaxID=1536 RepID=A0ABU0JSI6_HATLI|nr:recombinase family protein [Hathewaya limosa]MDQ0480049.1 hypothetical protein [Hathewaya limosa]